MDLVKRSIGLSKTIRNVSRAKEILSVFWRNGFDEIMAKSKLHRVLPGFVIPKVKYEQIYRENRDKDFWEIIGFRLRKSFEELGPSFIKIGQLISSREDILDPHLIKELKKLQSEAGSIDFEIAKLEIEKSLGKKINEVFSSFNETPIGTASIGIVFEATLLSGEQVVVKLRRPDIKKLIIHDFEIVSFLALKLEAVSEEFRYLGLSRAIDDFFESINLELNFIIEAQNCKKLKKNLSKIDDNNLLFLPDVFEDLSSESLIVMTRLDGKAFNEIGLLAKEDVLRGKLKTSVKYFIHTLLVDGFFHADLHGGNFFLLKNEQVGIIDFGLMGTLSKKNRENLIAILFALVSNNYENLVYEFLDVAEFEQIPDHEELTRDIQSALVPYIGLSVQDMDATAFVNSIVTTLSKHQMYLPRQWFIIFRSLMTLDGVGKSLGVDLNIFELIDDQMKGIVSNIVSKETLTEEATWIGRDALNSLRIIPRHLRWLLKEFAKKKYRLDIQVVGVNDQLNLLTRALLFLGLIIFSSTFFVCGVYFIKDISLVDIKDIPVITWIFWAISTLIFVRASFVARIK